ncbi:MAG: hypothetical protein ACE5EE_01855 [Fidelibacterota bacterium]
MKLDIRAVLVGLLFLMFLHAQENKIFWDGQDWVKLDAKGIGYPEFVYLAKASYVNGLLDGRLYDYLRVWPTDETLADSLFSDELSDYLRTSEIVRALDNFYRDPLNRYIPVSSAIVYVNMQAQQQPPEMLDAFKQKSKEWINNLTLQMMKENLYDVMKKKQKAMVEKTGED